MEDAEGAEVALLELLQASMEAAAWSEDRCQRSADVCRYGSALLGELLKKGSRNAPGDS